MIRGIDRKKGIISLIMGIIVSTGMNISLTRMATVENSPDLDFMNEKMVLVRNLYLSLAGGRMKLLLIAIVLTVLVYLGLSIRLKRWEKILLVCYSLAFSGCQLIAISFRSAENLNLLLDFPINRIRALIKGISYSIVCYFIVKDLLELVREQFIQRVAVERKPSKMRIFINAGLFFLAWFPYYLIFYPGTSNEDTVIQIMEYFHIPSYIQKMSPVQGADIFITNHHPYLLTLLFSQFIKLGLYLGDVNIGVAVYGILHMTFLAFVFAIALYYLQHVGVTAKRVLGVEIIVMFFPLFPLYSICMVKDTIYAAFCLFYMLMMNEVARTKGKVFQLWYFDLALFLDGLLMMLTKVYGMYILIVVGIIYFIVYRKYWWRILITFALPIFLFQNIFVGVLLPLWNVAPGGIQEALSVPFQQTARYVTAAPDEVTADERKAINEILPYQRLSKLYDPMLSDPVKKKYRQNASKEELKKYFEVWWAMFQKHPRVYLEATLNNTYEYYYVEKISSLEYYEFDTYLQEQDVKDRHTNLYVTNDIRMTGERYVVKNMVLALEKIPFVNVFASVGLLPWMIFFFILLNLFRKKKGYTIAMAIPILTLGICLVSADNGNFRYIMPIMFSLPFWSMLVLLPGEEYEEWVKPVFRKIQKRVDKKDKKGGKENESK